ncbi:hypothetical protein D3C87_104550 [compost metagenome]
MNARILKKIRSFRFATAMTVIGLTLISFQNCAPAQLCADPSDTTCNTDTENSGSSDSPSTGNPSTGNPVYGGGGSNGGGFGSTGGATNSGGGSGSNGTVNVGGGNGGGSGGGFGGGGSGGGSGGGVDVGAFRIVTQPASISVNEFADIQLQVGVGGGSPPYSFQWYKDGAAVNALVGTFFLFYDTADNYSKEGNYYVTVKDSTGATLQSSMARVSIVEPAVGCNAGTYYTFTSATYDYTSLIPGFLDSPRGKHLLPSGFPGSEVVLNIPAKYTGLSTYSFGAVAYRGQATLSCKSTVPRIHTPVKNPQYTNEFSSAAYNDSAYWQYQGSILFECRNQKLRLVSNTCNWKQIKAFDDNYHSGGNDSPGHGN